MSKFDTEHEKLVAENLIYACKNNELDLEVHKLRVLCDELRIENEKINSEKLQIELQSIKNQQNLINITSSNQKLEQLLSDKIEIIKILESERSNIHLEFNNFKISTDLEQNELRKQVLIFVVLIFFN